MYLYCLHFLVITGFWHLVKFISDRYFNSPFSFSFAKLCVLKIRLRVGTIPFWLMQINRRLYSFRSLRCQARLKLHSHKKSKLFKAVPEFDLFLYSLLLGMVPGTGWLLGITMSYGAAPF